MIFSRPLRSELQARLDLVRAMDKLRSLDPDDASDSISSPPQIDFQMSGLFGLIPGSDTAPIRIDSSRSGSNSM